MWSLLICHGWQTINWDRNGRWLWWALIFFPIGCECHLLGYWGINSRDKNQIAMCFRFGDRGIVAEGVLCSAMLLLERIPKNQWMNGAVSSLNCCAWAGKLSWPRQVEMAQSEANTELQGGLVAGEPRPTPYTSRSASSRCTRAVSEG